MQQANSLEILFRNFSTPEIEEISRAFSEIVPVNVGDLASLEHFSEEEEPSELGSFLPEVLFVLGLVSGSIATGFFKAFGSSLYGKTRERLLKVFGRRGMLTLNFVMSYKATVISIESRTTDREEVSKIFDTIDKARDIAVSELDKKETPEMTFMRIDYDNGWTFGTAHNSKSAGGTKFYGYNEKTCRWELRYTERKMNSERESKKMKEKDRKQ